MKLVLNAAIAITVVALALPWQAVLAQDFSALLDAVDKIEANLSDQVSQESQKRSVAITELQQSIKKLQATLAKSSCQHEELSGEPADYSTQLADLAAAIVEMQADLLQLRGRKAEANNDNLSQELILVRAELAAIQEQLHGDRPALASLDPSTLSMGTINVDQASGGNLSSPLDARSKLEENGVAFELVYTGEMSSTVSGGLAQRSEYLENGDVVLSIDAEQLMGWTGASFAFYALGDGGGSPSGNVGDMQGVSNIESDDTWKLYEAWYQQELAGGRLSFLAGLYDLNSEFDVTETAGLFLNASFGIGPDYSQSGENGPSIFPVTSLAFRSRVQMSDKFYFQNAILDGVPGDPEKPTGTHIKFGKQDGVLVATEVGFVRGGTEDSDAPYSKFALGTWLYTAKYDDVLDVDSQGEPIRRSGNSGLYLIGEQTVYREEDRSQGLALFARFGIADTKVNQIGAYMGGGLVYSGLFPGRDEDQLGFAVAAAFNGSKFKQAQREADLGIESAEVTLELSYSSQILSQLSIHPDLQYVINPGTDPDIKNGLVFTTRFELAF